MQQDMIVIAQHGKVIVTLTNYYGIAPSFVTNGS